MDIHAEDTTITGTDEDDSHEPCDEHVAELTCEEFVNSPNWRKGRGSNYMHCFQGHHVLVQLCSGDGEEPRWLFKVGPVVGDPPGWDTARAAAEAAYDALPNLTPVSWTRLPTAEEARELVQRGAYAYTAKPKAAPAASTRPSQTEMRREFIAEVLRDYAPLREAGLRTGDLLEYLRQQSWPESLGGVPRVGSLRRDIYSLAKAGILMVIEQSRRHGNRYRLGPQGLDGVDTQAA